MRVEYQENEFTFLYLEEESDIESAKSSVDDFKSEFEVQLKTLQFNIENNLIEEFNRNIRKFEKGQKNKAEEIKVITEQGAN